MYVCYVCCCCVHHRSGPKTAPVAVTKLYAPDAVLWGTVSEQLRVNPREIRYYYYCYQYY